MTKQLPLRFGILGAAKIAPNALTLPAGQVPGVEVTAIAARDPARAREFAKANGIPRVLATYKELIADPEIEIIYNPLPNSLHCEWSIRAMRAGKHVFCEKPIASNAAEAERMAQVADQTGLLLVEAFHYRYHPLADRVRGVIQSGAIGKLQHAEGNFSVPIPPDNIRFDWNLAGGATMDLGCYPLHMIRYFSGLTPRVIAANSGSPIRSDLIGVISSRLRRRGEPLTRRCRATPLTRTSYAPWLWRCAAIAARSQPMRTTR